MALAAMLVVVALVAAACGSSDSADETLDVVRADGPAADETSDEETSDEVIDFGFGPIDIDVELLTANAWTLRFGGGPTGQIDPIDGSPITLVFTDDGSFSGSTGCNNYGGSYEVDGPALFYADVFVTERACPGAIAAVEAEFLAALSDVQDTNVLPSELVLSGMATELIFVAVGDDDAASSALPAEVDVAPEVGAAPQNAAAPQQIDPSRVDEGWLDPGVDEVQLLVSNQSLLHEVVRISIEIDGEPVIDQDFDAGDQHNFFSFNVNSIAPGEHTITMRSDTGEELTKTFVKTDDPLWIIMLYWFDDFQPQMFTFELSNEPVAFA